MIVERLAAVRGHVERISKHPFIPSEIKAAVGDLERALIEIAAEVAALKAGRGESDMTCRRSE